MHYLLMRYASLGGFPVSVEESLPSVDAIRQSEPVVVIFPSVEVLEGAQALASELTNSEIPIIVCSSVLDQAKTRELGADYCLLHPLVFDTFSSTLNTIMTAKQENRRLGGTAQDSLPINPV